MINQAISSITPKEWVILLIGVFLGFILNFIIPRLIGYLIQKKKNKLDRNRWIGKWKGVGKDIEVDGEKDFNPKLIYESILQIKGRGASLKEIMSNVVDE